MVRRIALGLAWMMVFGSVAADAGERRAAAHTQLPPDDQRGVAYALAHTSDGGIVFSGRAVDLAFEKTSYPDGHFTLRLSSGSDVVSIAVSETGTVVARGNRSTTLGAAAGEQELDRGRSLLAGSKAVKRFRQLATALEQSDDGSAAAHGVMIGAAIVHLLDGDPGAPSRLARRLAKDRSAGALRQVARQDPQRRSEDCWDTYQARVNQAYNDFEDCQRARQWYNYEAMSYACSGVWMVRVEGYWFQYLKCSAFL